ncbi:MAG: DNA adenine methylase [Gemmatimonadota bacterium]|uniref:DNA adenine methylase n=1 Tax=Candidatus Palauibacter scopulicola TaxID=3056741 RepID=UPI00239CF738|nr:DNA adenine methylase [Candidatus Palauibacter scopulicola]MDE2662635.1 DNA adenine methylase [Candidatus Palauibacter scopulicola]
MRYLGNKTKLVPFLLETVDGFQETPGVACDPFAGTASVSAALKEKGWQVHAGDLMASSYALQVARVQLDAAPRYPASLLPAAARNGRREIGYHALLEGLAELDDPGGDGSGDLRDGEEPDGGFISEHYSSDETAGRAHGRMYFSPENGRKIDRVRRRIERWTRGTSHSEAAAQLLIATLIEAADRVANTTGVYASFVKTMQPNALRPLELRPIDPTPREEGAGACSAFRGPAARLLESIGPVDLVYLDPPYNGRQYPAYYHIPELLALGWATPPEIRGKTGLIPDEALRSDWCRKHRAPDALREVLEAADGRHILFSYNDEGHLDRAAIEAALRERGLPDTYAFHDRPYRRYRSDADGPGRSYLRDDVREHLHYVRCA